MPAPKDPIKYEHYISRLRESHLGYKMPKSQRLAISKALKGRSFSDSHKRNLSVASSKPRPWLCGKPSGVKGKRFNMPESAKRKISISQRGRGNSMFGKKPWNFGLNGYWTGERNPRWRGGVSPYPPEFSWSLRERVRKSTGRICVLSFRRESGRRLDVHHVDGDNQNNSFDNLIPLCCDLHNFLHANEEFFEGTLYWKPSKGVLDESKLRGG